MGACFSSDLDQQQLSFHSEPDENQASDTEDAIEIPSEESLNDSLSPESPSSVVVISKDVTDLREHPGYNNLDSFTYDEMRMATLLFRKTQVLGEGGFGVVYKGIIDESVRAGYTRTEVAIKQLNPEGMQGDKEWLTEVNYLARLRHPNLVKLIGYCCEENHRLLVYEYMAAGSLEDLLFIKIEKGSTHPLSWARRMKIALDAAKGLDFLHNAERPVIYRDFKSSNILLDADFNAKLSDFGIAKDGPRGIKTHVTTRVIGTQGYTAPEYAQTGHLRASCDIYAFGVVLIELLMGLRAIDKSRSSDMRSLAEWARPHLSQRREALELIDPRMDHRYKSKHVIKVANLAHRCVHLRPVMRPHMNEILETLESVQTDEASFQSELGSVTTLNPKKHRKSRKGYGENEASKGD